MAGISRYEQVTLGLTAAFVLFTGGWFLARQNSAHPYEVTTTQSISTEPEAEKPTSLPPEASEEEHPDSLLEGEVIEINTAGLEDLQRLPGIGEKRAQAIVDYREEHGPFQSVDELDNVDGIGEGILSGLRDYVTVDSQESGK